jgi:hypothetical protein
MSETGRQIQASWCLDPVQSCDSGQTTRDDERPTAALQAVAMLLEMICQGPDSIWDHIEAAAMRRLNKRRGE